MSKTIGINQEIVWQIVQQDLPELGSQMAQIINEFPAGDI